MAKQQIEHCPLSPQEYSDYLQSRHWKSFRLKAIKHHGKKCILCGIEEVLFFHVHHLTYKNLGHEKLTDVVVLCEACHTEVHKTGFVINPRQQKKRNVNRFKATRKSPEVKSRIDKTEKEKQLLSWLKNSVSDKYFEPHELGAYKSTKPAKKKKTNKTRKDVPDGRIGVIHNF